MNWWQRNSNTVLTIVEFVGFVGTVVSTGLAVSKISKKFEYEEFKKKKVVEKTEFVPGVSGDQIRDKTVKERSVDFVRAIFPEAVTPLIFGSVTIATMIGRKCQYSAVQQALIATAYPMGKRLYDEHKDEIKKAMDDICPLDAKDPEQFDNIEVSKNGSPENRNDIFMFEWSGRRFKSSVPDVDESIELCKQQFKEQGCISFNDIYLYHGINESKMGVENGFADMGRMNHPNLPDGEWEDLDIYRREVESPDGRVIHMICVGNSVEHVWWYQALFDYEGQGRDDSLELHSLL